MRDNKDNLLVEDDKEETKNVVKKKSKTKLVLGIGLGIITLGVTGTLIYLYLKKSNKLPNFIKKIKFLK